LYYAQPVRMGEDAEWTRVGLKDASAFNLEQYRVSAFIILILVILFLVFTTGMPFLKLMLLGKKEQLDTRDILYISCGIVLGTMLTTLLFLDIFDYTLSKKEKIDNNLKELNTSISENFLSELQDIYDQVSLMDRQYSEKNNTKELTNYLSCADSFSRIDSLQTDTIPYPYFIQVSWVDSTGSQEPFPKWTTRDKATSRIDVSKRYYFNGLKDPQNLWYLPGMEPGEGFVLEQIISWNTGEYLTVMGYQSRRPDSTFTEDIPYSASITTQLVSVTDPVVPEGFSFAIVDETGKVLYHSDSERSFHENLFDETEQSRRLKAAIYARHQKSFDIQYQGKPYRVHAAPIRYTTYTIITMAEMEYYRTGHVMTLMAVAMMALLLFALYGIQFFVKRVVTYRKSILDYHIPQFTWLRPDKRLNGFYGKIALTHVAHVLLLGLVVFFMKDDHPEYTIPLLYLAPSVSTYFSYFRLAASGWDQNKREDNGLTLAILLVVIIILVASFRLYGGHILYYLLPYLLVASLTYRILLFGTENISDKLKQNIRDSVIYKGYCRCNRYYLFILTFIVILAVVPVAGFYISANNQEARLAHAYHLLTFAKNLERKAGQFRKLTENRQNLDASGDNKWQYLDKSAYGFRDTRLYLSGPEAVASETFDKVSFIQSEPPRPDNDVLELLSEIRPFYNDLALKNNELVFGAASDKSYYFFPIQDSVNSQAVTYIGQDPADTIAVAGMIDTYDPFEKEQGITILLFIVIFILGLVFLYGAIRFSIQKIFLYQQLESPAIRFEPDNLKSLLDHNDIFIVGLPLSGRSYMLNDLKERIKGSKKVAIVDFRKWETRLRLTMISDLKKFEVIILEHLEYNWSVNDFNEIKLSFIGDLLAARSPGQKFVMCSAMHPQHLPDFTQDENLNLRRFLNMIKTFVKVFHPIGCDKVPMPEYTTPDSQQSSPAEAGAVTAISRRVKKVIKALVSMFGMRRNLKGISQSERLRYEVDQTIEKETRYGKYLESLREPLKNHFEDRLRDGSSANLHEEVILKVQSMANPYYQSLWNCLTLEEKVVVIDMAKDTLVNDRNMRTINILINKGILRYDTESERVHLLNNSFRNFVLTRLTDKEEERLLEEIKGHKTWETFKTPAIIIAVTIVLFLFATQQETVDQIIGFVSASAASITVLARVLSGVFNKRKEQAQA
ncbi:MAG: cache domain-containing protein, partial [Cyclobacteriaceae bacterium]